MKKNVETYYEGDSWKNRRQGNQRATSVHETKAKAQSAGRDLAQRDGVEHIIKNMNGQISGRNSYGKDPHPPKG